MGNSRSKRSKSESSVSASSKHAELKFDDSEHRFHSLKIKSANEVEVKSEVLGRGGFSEVRLCQHKKSHQYLAMKRVERSRVSRDHGKRIMIERDVLLGLNHPFIIHLHGTFQDDTYLYFIFELMQGGDIATQLKHYSAFSVPVARFYAAEVVYALEYLHSRNIIHRDVKLKNLMLDANGHIRLIDFGCVGVIENNKTRLRSLCGTHCYFSPERIRGLPQSFEVDWWALGIAIYYMLTGKFPFWDEDRKQLHNKILNDSPHFPSSMDAETVNLISKFLIKDPSQRLGHNGSKEVKAHPWFSSVNWNEDLWERRNSPAPAFNHNLGCFPDEPALDPKVNQQVFGDF